VFLLRLKVKEINWGKPAPATLMKSQRGVEPVDISKGDGSECDLKHILNTSVFNVFTGSQASSRFTESESEAGKPSYGAVRCTYSYLWSIGANPFTTVWRSNEMARLEKRSSKPERDGVLREAMLPPHRLGGLGERGKLPEWDPGRTLAIWQFRMFYRLTKSLLMPILLML